MTLIIETHPLFPLPIDLKVKIFFVISIFQIVVKSLTFLNKQDAHSWLQFKQKVKFDEPVITICDVNKQINKPQQLPWKPYDRLLLQRWLRVVQISHTISP